MRQTMYLVIISFKTGTDIELLFKTMPTEAMIHRMHEYVTGKTIIMDDVTDVIIGVSKGS